MRNTTTVCIGRFHAAMNRKNSKIFLTMKAKVTSTTEHFYDDLVGIIKLIGQILCQNNQNFQVEMAFVFLFTFYNYQYNNNINLDY